MPVVERAHYDVIVAGAGIAGSALAVSLSGSGLSVALVEARPLTLPQLPATTGVGDFDTRVSALTPSSRATMQSLGVWDAISACRLCPYHHMTVWDADGTGRIDFDRAEVDADALGYIVENRVIAQALLRRVSQLPDVHLLDGSAIETCERAASGVVRVGLSGGGVLAAKLLVAADGALSPLRELMGFRTREWDYGHRAIVATVEVQNGHAHTAWQRFLPSGPLALLPLPGDAGAHYCSIVWSTRDELADDLLAMDEPAFAAALAQASEWTLGGIRACSERQALPLRQRHAVDYTQPGVALVGDAAHTIHPLAGQGINLGLLDIAALSGEITDGVSRGVSPGDATLLRRYQRRRKGENLLMMTAMEGFKRLFEQEAPPLRWLRNEGMRRVDRLPPLKRRLIRHAMGID